MKTIKVRFKPGDKVYYIKQVKSATQCPTCSKYSHEYTNHYEINKDIVDVVSLCRRHRRGFNTDYYLLAAIYVPSDDIFRTKLSATLAIKARGGVVAKQQSTTHNRRS